MPSPDLARLDAPLGPYRDAFVVDISSEDYVLEEGFVFQLAATGGTIRVRWLGASGDTSWTLAANGYVSVAGVQVISAELRQIGRAHV